MKKLFIILLLLLNGCITVLRYNYEAALMNLPDNVKIVDINNDYILYNKTNVLYRAYYESDTGKIFKTIPHKK